MKTTIKIMLCMAILILPLCGFAQHAPSQISTMDVNGVFLGGTYTKSQVTAKWGQPTKYESQTSEFGLLELYDYGNNSFEFSDNGIFHSFFIDAPNFVFWASKSGGFKVGDPVSRLKTIGIIPNSTSLSTGTGKNVVEIPGGDDWFKVGYSNGIITWISYTSSI
jgi:hypothetical protein